MMSSAAGLAYNLINALIPLATALFAVLVFTVGRLDSHTHAQLIQRLTSIFPAPISSQNILEPALTAVSKHVDFLMLIALLTAIFGGVHLFTGIESTFDIIYQTSMRKTIPKYVMAMLMLCVFIVLTPLMFFASSIPALILMFIENAALNHLPGVTQLIRNGFALSVASILESLTVTWFLFAAIYTVVPNRKIRFKHSWKGALIAAFLLEIFMILFPFYITHFMGNYTGFIGFLLISLFFFYYFSVILLIGAEINAVYAEGVPALPGNLANFIHQKASEAARGDAAREIHENT